MGVLEDKPLSPKEVDALQPYGECELIAIGESVKRSGWVKHNKVAARLWTTVRDRERQRDGLEQQAQAAYEVFQRKTDKFQLQRSQSDLAVIFARRERDELQRQLVESQKDTERLDWMSKQVEQWVGKNRTMDFILRVDNLGIYLWGWDPKPILREAIDAAREAEHD